MCRSCAPPRTPNLMVRQVWFLMKPRVLVACEYSGRVRDEFTARGWDAWSCDFEPSDTPGQHCRGDVRDLLTQHWDMMIAFPPCTYLCSSGMHWTTRGLRDPKLTEEALDFVHLLLNSGIPRIAIENPIGAINTRICKPTQIIQPYQFGDDASKRTCLWLKNLPPLVPTDILPLPAAVGGPIKPPVVRTNSVPVPPAGRSVPRHIPASPALWPINGVPVPTLHPAIKRAPRPLPAPAINIPDPPPQPPTT